MTHQEKLRAFVDDLQALSEKHGLVLAESFGYVSAWPYDEEYQEGGKYLIMEGTAEFEWVNEGDEE